jgi:hypothetical protein
MKITILYSLLVMLISSCSSNTEQNKTLKAKEEQMNIFVKELNDYPSSIQEIIISENQLIRNVSLGYSKEQVRGVEKLNFTQSNEELHLLIAEGDLSDDISLDVEYQFTQHKLSSISLIIYTTGKEQQTRTFENLKEILTKKFQLSPSVNNWFIENNTEIKISKVGNEKEFDIELIFKLR